MPRPDQANPFDADAYRDPEAQLGGADNVEKTTYVKGEGTSAGDGSRQSFGRVTPRWPWYLPDLSR